MNSQMTRYIDEVWEGPECSNFCSCGIGVHHSLDIWLYSSVWKLLKLSALGVFMEALYVNH